MFCLQTFQVANMHMAGQQVRTAHPRCSLCLNYASGLKLCSVTVAGRRSCGRRTRACGARWGSATSTSSWA